jgi:hypothetical protein
MSFLCKGDNVSIHDIINELNQSNSSTHKINVLKKNKPNETLQRVLKMTYDKVVYRYYLTMNHWYKTVGPNPFASNPSPTASLDDALNFLESKLSTRQLTGHDAIVAMDAMFMSLSDRDRELMIKVINRDLRINCGRTQINKVFGDLITKPVYMRCDVFSAKTAKGITLPAFIQLKADGTYREMQVLNGKAEFLSRSGEQYEYTFAEELAASLPDGHYIGEMTVEGTQNRAESNGLLNSDDPPMDRIIFELWDYITPEEYTNAARKVKNTIKYSTRLRQLMDIIQKSNHRQLKVIQSHVVNTIQEAFDYVVKWMEGGLEGGIFKDPNGIFKDGTSKQQLKMKLEMDIDVRITGFKEGTIGTKRESTFGAITFETDDGKIKGAVSGFSDDQLKQINSDRDSYIDKIMSVSCNDITKGRNNDHYALSHPRFNEVRTDKSETDTLERALEIKQMAMCFA